MLASIPQVKTEVRMNATDVIGLCATLQYGLITVARDRDSDSERLLYFGRVSFFYFFFRPPNFRRPCVRFSRNFATRRGMC